MAVKTEHQAQQVIGQIDKTAALEGELQRGIMAGWRRS